MPARTPKANRPLKRDVQRKSVCGIEVAIAVLGGRWKPLLLYHLTSGTKRFSELKRLTPQASQRMLTQQLRELEADGLINRTVFPVVPPKVEYSLTEHADELLETLRPLSAWGLKWQRETLERSPAGPEHVGTPRHTESTNHRRPQIAASALKR